MHHLLRRILAMLLALLCLAPVCSSAEKLVALTFDDGPNTTTSLQVLSVLQEYDVKATFFLIGQNITPGTRYVVEREFNAGMEIACHSNAHAYMNTMTADEVTADINACVLKITDITGQAPAFFRPPYIAVSGTMMQVIDMPFICGIGCNDWDASVTAQQRIDSVLAQVKDGDIILMHDFSGNTQTVEAIRVIIPALLEQGYEFVTVSELFERKHITPGRNKVYSNALQVGMY